MGGGQSPGFILLKQQLLMCAGPGEGWVGGVCESEKGVGVGRCEGGGGGRPRMGRSEDGEGWG